MSANRNFSMRVWPESRRGKEICPLIRAVHLLERLLTGDYTVQLLASKCCFLQLALRMSHLMASIKDAKFKVSRKVSKTFLFMCLKRWILRWNTKQTLTTSNLMSWMEAKIYLHHQQISKSTVITLKKMQAVTFVQELSVQIVV